VYNQSQSGLSLDLPTAQITGRADSRYLVLRLLRMTPYLLFVSDFFGKLIINDGDHLA
jgi:hypothetical protein